MFKALPTGSLIADAAARIVALYRSTNTRTMALGPRGEQVARAWVAGALTPTGRYRVWVYLGVDGSSQNEGLLFRCDPEEVGVEDYSALLEAARSLVSGHGFGMEKLAVRMMDHARRDEILRALPIDPRATADTSAPHAVDGSGPQRVGAPPRPDELEAEALASAPTERLPNRREGPPPLPPPPPPVTGPDSAFPTDTWAQPVDISREISLPAHESVDVLGRLLLLF